MKLLLIGNNHIYQNNLPETVRSLLEMTGQKSHVTLLFAPGKTLSQHAADAAVRFNITFGRYDAVIAQNAVVHHVVIGNAVVGLVAAAVVLLVVLIAAGRQQQHQRQGRYKQKSSLFHPRFLLLPGFAPFSRWS